jgi:hypothetical protein
MPYRVSFSISYVTLRLPKSAHGLIKTDNWRVDEFSVQIEIVQKPL